jgi:hypothetical protein
MVIQLQNFYKDTLKKDVTSTGATKFYLTLAKPTVVPGIVVISPNSPSLREIIKYTATGTDSIGDYLEVTDAGHRGLGGTTAREHKYLEPVRGNITKEHLESLLESPTISDPTFTGEVTVPEPTQPDHAVSKQFAEALANAGASDAQTTGKGISRLSTAPGTTLGTATMTIASPGVFTKASHGLTVNDMVKFTTTGALPTGIIANTVYYVIATDLTTDTFKLATTQGGSAINTSGSQSGTHTLIKVTPTAVSDTDPRLPTQAENDAMQGTSGSAVSGSNKLVDNADTTGTGLVVRSSLLDLLDRITFTAGEDISSLATPLAVTDRPDNGDIMFDKVASGHNIIGTTFSQTVLITPANNNNRVLVIAVQALRSFGSTTDLTLTVDGVTKTPTISGGNGGSEANYRTTRIYVVPNPPTTVNSIVITGTNNGQNWDVSTVVYSLYNVAQTGTVDTSAYSGNSSGITSIALTQAVRNGMIFTSSQSTVGDNALTNQNSETSGSTKNYCGLSGISKDAGSKTVTLTSTITCASLILVPSSTYATRVVKASASTPTNTAEETKYLNFIGFNQTTAVSGATLSVKTSNVASGFSGLIIGRPYYLANTAGTIALTAGSNSKKVGVAVSATELLLINS